MFGAKLEMMTLNEAFAFRAKEIMQAKKITQYKITQETSIYPSTMNYILHGKTKASNFKTMVLIIRALGVSVAEFFNSPVFDFENLEVE